MKFLNNSLKTFRKRYIVERTNEGRNKTGRTEWEYREFSGEFMEWNTSERAIREKQTKEESKRSGQARLVYVKDINLNIPTTWRCARGDPRHNTTRQNFKPLKSNTRKNLWNSPQTTQKITTNPSHCWNLNRHFKSLMTRLLDPMTFTIDSWLTFQRVR